MVNFQKHTDFQWNFTMGRLSLKILSLLLWQILIKHGIALNLYIIWKVELGIVQNHLNVIKDRNRFKYRLSFNVSGRLFSQINTRFRQWQFVLKYHLMQQVPTLLENWFLHTVDWGRASELPIFQNLILEFSDVPS